MNQNPTKIQFFQLGNGINFLALTLLLLFTPYAAAQIGITDPPAPPPPGFQLNPKIKVSPSMAVILVCLFSAFFVMGCVSIGVRYFADRRLALSDVDFLGGGSQRVAARGLDAAVVDAFPVFLYSDVKALKIGSTALECAVCLNEFESDETLRLLPKCSHVFHPDCIDAWLACHVTCPVCRANLEPRHGELRPVSILCHDVDTESLNSGLHDSARVINDTVIDIESPVVINPTLTPNRNRPPRSTPRKVHRESELPRSYSAGYSELNQVSNYERFTLRLPEEVRTQLMNSSLIRTRSCVTFTRVQSSRKGYRSSSVGGSSHGRNYERFDQDGQSDRWGLTKTPPFFSRVNSARSPKISVWDGLTVKSPFDCLGGGTNKDESGKQVFDRLRP